jgi:hypothetical protein
MIKNRYECFLHIALYNCCYRTYSEITLLKGFASLLCDLLCMYSEIAHYHLHIVINFSIKRSFLVTTVATSSMYIYGDVRVHIV